METHRIQKHTHWGGGWRKFRTHYMFFKFTCPCLMFYLWTILTKMMKLNQWLYVLLFKYLLTLQNLICLDESSFFRKKAEVFICCLCWYGLVLLFSLAAPTVRNNTYKSMGMSCRTTGVNERLALNTSGVWMLCLIRLFSIIWRSGTVPLDGQPEVVFPIHKKKEPRVCSN